MNNPIDLPKFNELAPIGSSAFLWRGLSVRYNVEGDQTAVSIDPDGSSTYFSILTLEGFTPENGALLGCYWKRDESLPPGTMVLEPFDRKRE